MVKNLIYVKAISVNPLYLVIYKINWYTEEISENKYLTLVSTDKSKELWTKIRDLIRSKTNNSGNFDDKYVKINFNSELYNIVIVVRAVFQTTNITSSFF